MWIKRLIVRSLEKWCNRLHFITHHRPYLWLPIKGPAHCLLADWSDRLDKRWGTDEWTCATTHPEDNA